MSWWGAIVGGTFGFMLGGPIGALLGAALGQTFGRAVSNATIETGTGTENLLHDRAELAFLTATFGVMGHVAKADGRVSPREIQLANRVMQMFQLNAEQRKAARAIFNEGKKPNFPLADVLTQLRTECNRSPNLLRMFLEIQFQAAWMDGGTGGRLDATKHHLLQSIATHLHFTEREFAEIERLVASGMHAQSQSDGPTLEDAYATLGVSPDAPDDEVRRAYRRLMNRHHPDKLQAKGLPEEMMRAATERTQQIKAAWNRVKGERGDPPSRSRGTA